MLRHTYKVEINPLLNACRYRFVLGDIEYKQTYYKYRNTCKHIYIILAVHTYIYTQIKEDFFMYFEILHHPIMRKKTLPLLTGRKKVEI